MLLHTTRVSPKSAAPVFTDELVTILIPMAPHPNPNATPASAVSDGKSHSEVDEGWAAVTVRIEAWDEGGDFLGACTLRYAACKLSLGLGVGFGTTLPEKLQP